LVFSVCLSLVATAAKPLEWQDGVLTEITSDAPGATAPGLETVFGYNVKRSYYWIRAGNITYVLVNSWAVGFHAPKAPLNVTLNGKVKIAIEGRNAYIIDNSGRKLERPIVTKIAEPASP
jgi:hypothetical protein